MPRPRPPFLNRVVTRHGKIVWVVRVGTGDDRRRVRLRAEYGTPEFKREYEAAIAAAEREEPVATKGGAAAEGTIAWLIDRYRDTPIWKSFSPETRRERETFFKRAVTVCGDVQAYRITRESILGSLEARAATPSHVGRGRAPHRRPDGRRPQSRPAGDSRLPDVERRARRRLRGEMSHRDAAKGMARRLALHRTSPW